MKKLFIITGANGHLGKNIIRILLKQDVLIRGLILPLDQVQVTESIVYIRGDVCDPQSLHQLFDDCDQYETYVIHTAGIIQITNENNSHLYDVNVNGTKNMVLECLKHPIKKFVYISSVHAIAESSGTMKEVNHFSPQLVKGAYAKTKAEASQYVLDATKKGLHAVIVHPSGIIGPYGDTSNHLIQLIDDYIHYRIPACVRGGYDFVDVRDVAQGSIQAALIGKSGECYILSNQYYHIKELFQMIRKIHGGPHLINLPISLAKIFAPMIEKIAKSKHKRPLYTQYSLVTLQSNSHFSHEKATHQLHYHTRDFKETLTDTITYLLTQSVNLNKR